MKLSAPTRWVFLVSAALAVIGFLPLIGISFAPTHAQYADWTMAGAWILLALGTVLKGF